MKTLTDIYVILRSNVNGISSVSYEVLKEGIDRTQDLFPQKAQASAAGAQSASVSEGLTLLQTSLRWRPSFAGAALTLSRVWGARGSTTSLVYHLSEGPSRHQKRSWYVQPASWIWIWSLKHHMNQECVSHPTPDKSCVFCRPSVSQQALYREMHHGGALARPAWK